MWVLTLSEKQCTLERVEERLCYLSFNDIYYFCLFLNIHTWNYRALLIHKYLKYFSFCCLTLYLWDHLYTYLWFIHLQCMQLCDCTTVDLKRTFFLNISGECIFELRMFIWVKLLSPSMHVYLTLSIDYQAVFQCGYIPICCVWMPLVPCPH